jgi:hypothetical protein
VTDPPQGLPEVAHRTVRVVLCDASGAVLGALPVLGVRSPWWPHVAPIVEAVRARHGLRIDVLRLLDGPDEPGAPGAVTYLAEVQAPVPAGTHLEAPGALALDDDPLRLPYARPGGVAAVLAWAEARLAARGIRLHEREQVRTWDLSLVLRLGTSAGTVWCKAVPPFFAHEGAAIDLLAPLAPGLLPEVIAHEPGRLLLRHVPGEDAYDSGAALLIPLVEAFVELQVAAVDVLDRLLGAGAPDWRAQRLAADVADLVVHPETAAALDRDELAELRSLVAELPDRLEALGACGLPETLVHGDLHAGNVRADGGRLVLLDWGDCGVGHALLDEAALLERAPSPTDERVVRDAWVAAWRRHRPRADAATAMTLVPPVAALRQALIYRTFLDRIEPTERRYHRADVPLWLRRAIAARRDGAAG